MTFLNLTYRSEVLRIMTDEFKAYALHLKNQKLFEMERLYQENLDNYLSLFQENFLETCQTITRLQNLGKLGKISYLEYNLLYTCLIQKKETAEVRVYNDEWYFDSRQQTVGSFDFSYLFPKYRELQTELMDARKRFAGSVTAQDVTSFVLSCAPQFYRYVIAVCRFSILPCIETETFRSILRADQFEINVGEYMACTEAVYKENQAITSEEALRWFSLREEYEYAYESFTGLDFSGADLSEIDLRYSDLRHTKLIGTDFQDSMLYGTRFSYADMRGADLRYCHMHEADFTGADLTNACFTAAESYAGVPGNSEWIITGYQRVSFRNAILSHADFRRSRIRDADFTGATLDGTLFLNYQLDDFDLSLEQRQAIQVADI